MEFEAHGSRDGAPNVSLDVSRPEAMEPPSERRNTRAPRKAKHDDSVGAAPGRYLVRSGSVYLFQIRLPVDIGGASGRILRLSLGPLTAKDARHRAELLAATARERFRELRSRRMATAMDETNAGGPPEFGGDTPEITAAEVKGYLRAMLQVISQDAEPPPHQRTVLAGYRNLILLNREIAKGSDASPFIAENAAALQQQAIDRIQGATPDSVAATGHADIAQQAPPPAQSAVPQTANPGRLIHRIHRDADGTIIPAFRLDRRTVERLPSDLPKLSDVAVEYLKSREIKLGEGAKDLKTGKGRLAIFLDLIGDHPVDTYGPADMQAFIALMTHWPADPKHRPAGLSPRAILAANAELVHKPLTRSALEDGYVTIARSAIRHKMKDYGYADPFSGATLQYPNTAAPRQSTEPLSFEQMNRVFKVGAKSGLLDEAVNRRGVWTPIG